MATRVTRWAVTPVVRCGVALPRNATRQTTAGTVWKGRARRGCGVKDWRVTLCDEPRRDRNIVVAAASTVASDSGAVLLFGATGRIGRAVLQQLLETGRPVVAAVRSAAKLEGMGFGGEGLRVVDGVDMMKPETLTAALFSGVQQVVLCSGPAWRNTNPDTVTDPYDPATVFAYSVDSVGVMNVVAAAERHLTPVADMTILNSVDLVPDMSWTDASIGASTSRITPDANGIRMEGTLEQGERVRDLTPKGTIQWADSCALDLTGADGLTFSVRGDGRSHFITLQNDETGSHEQSFFAASFDTVDGQWTEVKLPLHHFRLVKQGIPDQTATLAPSPTARLGWMSSTKTVDGFPNRKSPAGDFSFSVASVSTYRAARPQLVHLSSAGQERSARIGENIDRRNEETVPIMRLNPGGVLNHKFEGNSTVRCSTLPYTIVCPNGFISEELETGDLTPDLLQFSQGDTTAGRLRFVELAEVILQCLQRPEAVSKTFEVRRSPGIDAKNKSMTDAHYLRQFLTLSNDEDRPRVGLPPYPEPVSVDAPVWRGGRKNERPDEALVNSIFQGVATANARRNKELLPQTE